MIDGVNYLGHRLAWFYVTGRWPVEVDHHNRVKGDDRWRNLRELSHPANCANVDVRRHSRSGVKGVYWEAARGKWHAYIDRLQHRKHLGRFTTLAAAKSARRNAEFAA